MTIYSSKWNGLNFVKSAAEPTQEIAKKLIWVWFGDSLRNDLENRISQFHYNADFFPFWLSLKPLFPQATELNQHCEVKSLRISL